MTLHLGELRLSRLPHADLKIKDGLPKPGLLNLKLDSDEIARANVNLAVRGVTTSSEKSNDVLRVTLATPSGASATLAFQFVKGALAGLSEEALKEALSPVITPAAGWSAGAGNNVGVAQLPSATAHGNVEPPAKRSSIVDLPSAAPDLPPMHADTPAEEGCWLEPYYSASLGVELAYQQCATNSPSRVKVAENVNSIYATTPDGQEVPLLIVYTKRPEESLEAAVKRIIISKFRDPASRTGCVAKASVDAATNKPVVDIAATGLYAKRKSYPLGKGGYPCDGYLANEDESTEFWEFPSENRSSFVEIRDTKADVSFRTETIHFRSGTTTQAVAPASNMNSGVQAKTEAKGLAKLPPMRDVWISQGRIPGVDVVDEASTAVSFTHGMIFDSSAGDAVMAIGCRKQAGKEPSLVLTTFVPPYRFQQTTLANNVGSVFVGSSKHDQQLAVSTGTHGLTILVPLNAQDASEMSANEFITSRQISLSYFSGAGQDIAAGNLPPANDALDAVLHACNITTPPRTVMMPERNLSPDEVKRLVLAKLTLGSTASEIKSSLGPSFRFIESPNTNNKSVSYLLAATSTDKYGMTLIDGTLRAFSYMKDFSFGSQPLAVNLIRDVTAKTWTPLTGTTMHSAVWSSTSADIPIDLAHERDLANCRIIRNSSVGTAPQGFSSIVVGLVDAGPACGVTLTLSIGTGRDPAIANSMTLLVADDAAIHTLLRGVSQQQEQERDDQRRKANHISTPF